MMDLIDINFLRHLSRDLSNPLLNRETNESPVGHLLTSLLIAIRVEENICVTADEVGV